MLELKYKITNLPITEEFLKEKRINQQRGELALIANGATIRHISYFSLKAGPNFQRGGHFHKCKTEYFYVVSGKGKVILNDIETNEEKELIIAQGDKLAVAPLCAHKFNALEYMQIIEYSDLPYDASDDYVPKRF